MSYDLANFGFDYIPITVLKQNESLLVDGYPVSEKDWYTFRYLFNSTPERKLTVNFELAKNGPTLHERQLKEDLLGNQITHLMVEDLGNGYLWFVTIADGVDLATDELRVRWGN